MSKKEDFLELSPLGHTWVLDLDGTILKHNGYKTDGYDTFLDGAREFLSQISNTDMVVFITSRDEKYREMTEAFLCANCVRYDTILFGAPYGERILVNDRKESGLVMAHSVSPLRDVFDLHVKVNLEL